MDSNHFKPIDNLFPTDEAVQRTIQKAIQAEKDEKIVPFNKPKKYKLKSTLLIAAAVVTVVVVSAMSVNAASNGRLFDSLKSMFSGDEVLANITTVTDTNPIYAPNINYIDDNTLIFSTSRGLVVYDRNTDRCIKTIDLQAIDCLYITSGEEFAPPENKTHILKDKNYIIIFNTKLNADGKGRTPFAEGYKYGIYSKDSSPEKITDGKMLADYYKKWSVIQKLNYRDTFDSFAFYVNTDDYLYSNALYSCMSYVWNGSNGEKYSSFLTVNEDTYNLITLVDSTEKPISQTLALSSDNDKNAYREANSLPKFLYTGDDDVMRTIIEYGQNNYFDELQEGAVWIPAYTISATVLKDDELLVFGQFWVSSFKRSGKILELMSFRQEVGCIHLEKNTDGYRVSQVDFARSGSSFKEDIDRMAEDYPDTDSYDTWWRNNGNIDSVIKNSLKMYVEYYNLDIEFCDLNQGAVRIFE